MASESKRWPAMALLDFTPSGVRWHPAVVLESDARQRFVVATTKSASHAPSRLVMMPGLVNAHTHLGFTNAVGLMPRRVLFPQWLAALKEWSIGAGAAGIAASVRDGLELSRQAGVVALGEISSVQAGIEYFADSPLRGVHFSEWLCPAPSLMSSRRAEWEPRWRAVQDSAAVRSGRWRMGLSPHAPHTVAKQALHWSLEHYGIGRPLAMHIAETPDEMEFLRHGTGSFGDYFRERSIETERTPVGDGDPFATLEHSVFLPARQAMPMAGLLDRIRNGRPAGAPMTMIVHGNYAPRTWVDRCARAHAAVCWCPETHEFFGHDPWTAWKDCPVPVVIGTDSLASATSLNPLVQIGCGITRQNDWRERLMEPSQMLYGVSLGASDALLGHAGGPPLADATILRVSEDVWRSLSLNPAGDTIDPDWLWEWAETWWQDPPRAVAAIRAGKLDAWGDAGPLSQS